MLIANLTSTEAIRAVLGISDDNDELSDQVFIDNATDLEIGIKINLWLKRSGVPWTVQTLLDENNSERVGLLGLIAKYVGSLLYVPQLATMTAISHSDGQDEFKRQTRDLKQLEEDLVRQLGEYQEALLELLGPAEVATFTIMGIASPVYDPITG